MSEADRVRRKMGPGMKLERFDVYPSNTPHTDEARAAVPKEDFGESYWFWCPGCKTHHKYTTKLAKGDTGPLWQFNGNMESPSFTPSLLYRGWIKDGNENGRCHMYLTNGQIIFLGDCSHKLKGQTVPLEKP